MENHQQITVDQEKGTQRAKDDPAGTSVAVPHAPSALPDLPYLAKQLSREVYAQIFHNKGFLKLDFFMVFWLFVAGSMIGLGLETVFRAIQFGGYESRAGLVWGPFSPIYGAGAVILTAALNRFYHTHNLIIFLIAMIVGASLEYATSWGMQHFWGAIAWDYSGTFGNINGRTNFAFGIMWGLLGLVWVRIMMPLIKHVFSLFDRKKAAARVITAAMACFMAVNIVVTVFALDREGQRASGIPASNPIQYMLDERFPDSFMHARFENMSVYGKGN